MIDINKIKKKWQFLLELASKIGNLVKVDLSLRYTVVQFYRNIKFCYCITYVTIVKYGKKDLHCIYNLHKEIIITINLLLKNKYMCI